MRRDRHALASLGAAVTIVVGLAVASPSQVQDSIVQRLNGGVTQQRALTLPSDDPHEANSEKIKG